MINLRYERRRPLGGDLPSVVSPISALGFMACSSSYDSPSIGIPEHTSASAYGCIVCDGSPAEQEDCASVSLDKFNRGKRMQLMCGC